MELELKAPSLIDVVLLQEDIARGQRAEAFCVEAQVNGTWQEVCRGTTIGYKRLLQFPPVKAERIRIRMQQCRLPVLLGSVAAYHAGQPQETTKEAEWNNLPRTAWRQCAAQPLTIDLGEVVTLTAFTYAPERAEVKPTTAFRYRLSISTDGKQWHEVTTAGEFGNIMHNPVPQTVVLSEPARARFVKLEGTTVTGNKAVISLQEFGVTVDR